VLWRLGGRNSSFAEPPGARTAWQHDPRVLSDGTISIFDNGSSPTVHSQSRVIVVALNHATSTATLVSQLTHGPALVAESQGNVQALDNGDWFVGWGQVPDFSEFGAEGNLLFDAHFPAHDQSYRSFRFAWTGAPAHLPTFAMGAGAAGGSTAYATWNGATQVSTWRVLAGASASALVPVAQAPRSGFETAVAVPAGTAGPYVAVQALDGAGNSLGVSAVASDPALAGAG
jgi:Arylsulfotransferase (ASST)